MLNSTRNYEQFLISLSFFKDLSTTDVSDFLKQSHIKEYKKNQPVFLYGDKADRLFIIVNGWIKLHRETLDGEEAIKSIITRGDIFGEACIFSEEKYLFSAHCVEEAQLIEIPAGFLKDKAKKNQIIMSKILDVICHETKNLYLENEHIAIMSAPQRVGCLLLRLSIGMQGTGGKFEFPYDKSLAATQLGMKPETFSRALTLLKPLGVHTQGSEITIDSFENLMDYCCEHCSAEPSECERAEYCNHQCIKNKIHSSS